MSFFEMEKNQFSVFLIDYVLQLINNFIKWKNISSSLHFLSLTFKVSRYQLIKTTIKKQLFLSAMFFE